MTGDGTDPGEAGAMASEAEKPDGTDDDDVLISEKEIDAKMQAAEQEKKYFHAIILVLLPQFASQVKEPSAVCVFT